MSGKKDAFARKRVCPNPFLSLEVLRNGMVCVCCTDRLKEGYKYVGNILEEPLDSIWNGERIKKMRRLMLEGRYGESCESYCPQFVAFSRGEVPPWYGEFSDAEVEAAIEGGRDELATPWRTLSIASDGSCNLACIMCRSDFKTRPAENEKKINEALYDQAIEKIREIRFLELTGDGDPFFNRDIMKFLERLGGMNLDHLTIRFITNLQLFDEGKWALVERLRVKSVRMAVSIDAASKDTYEAIRRGGRWEKLKVNMEMIAEKRRSGDIERLETSFVVMKRNIGEMEEFVRLCEAWGCDKVYFQRISGVTAGLENIFDVEDPKSLETLAGVFNTAEFSKSFVDFSPLAQYKGYRATEQKLREYRKAAMSQRVRGFLSGMARKAAGIIKGGRR